MDFYNWFIGVMSVDRVIAALIGFAIGLLTYILNVRKFRLDLDKEKREVDKYRRELQSERDSIFPELAAIIQESMEIFSEIERSYSNAISEIQTHTWIRDTPVESVREALKLGLSIASKNREACYSLSNFLLTHGPEYASKDALQTTMAIRLNAHSTKQHAALACVGIDNAVNLHTNVLDKVPQIMWRRQALLAQIDQIASMLRKTALLTNNAFPTEDAERKLDELRQKITAFSAARIDVCDVEELNRLYQEVINYNGDITQRAQQFIERIGLSTEHPPHPETASRGE